MMWTILKIKRNVENLLKENNVEEARKIIDQIDKEKEGFRLHLLVKIAEYQGNVKERKELLIKILDVEPKNIRTISSLVGLLRKEWRVANDEGNIKWLILT